MTHSGIQYKIQTAAEKDIYEHLKECNDNFAPSLDQRVDLERYSKKIFEKAVTFEAWEGDLFVGFVALYVDRVNRTTFITNVSTLKSHMGLGIASELLKRCIDYAKQNDFSEINLEVFKDNRTAISLYEKFRFTGSEIKNEFLAMQLRLNN